MSSERGQRHDLGIYTGTTFNALLARHRKDLARDIAAQNVNGIEKLLPLPCNHQNRKSCPVCAERRTVIAAVKVVLDTGGQP